MFFFSCSDIAKVWCKIILHVCKQRTINLTFWKFNKKIINNILLKSARQQIVLWFYYQAAEETSTIHTHAHTHARAAGGAQKHWGHKVWHMEWRVNQRLHTPSWSRHMGKHFVMHTWECFSNVVSNARVWRVG